MDSKNKHKMSSALRVAGQAEETVRHAEHAAKHTSEAAAETTRAAEQTAAAAHVTKSSAERTTELAADRTLLAFERTYAAWVRTGLVALASGIGARKLLEGVLPEWMIIGTGTVLLLFSAFCFVAGVWRHLLHIETPAPEAPKLPSFIFLVVNGVLALVALAACFGLLIGAPR